LIPALTLLLCAVLFAQYSGDFVLGGKRLFGASAPYLREDTPLSQALASPAYLASVGGVAFDQVAKPAAGVTGAVSVTYDPSAADGERLGLVIGGQTVRTSLYDWMMIPVAKYANSQYTACFTLFGSLNDPKLQAEVESSVDQSKRAMNYHPQLANTLVGLRIFQLDEHILSEDSADLPKLKGEYVLGRGETPPNIQRGLDALSRLQDGIDAQPDNDFQSYVVCDYHRAIEFSADRGRLSVTGDPYYYFWREGAGNRIVYVKGLSDWVSAQQPLLRQINPAVWDSAVNLMRYAAFFRFCKGSQPGMWQEFMKQIAAAEPEPRIQTPTYMIDPAQ